MSMDSRSKKKSHVGGFCHLLWGRHEGEWGVNTGSQLSAASQLYRTRGIADTSRAATSAMTWWGTRGLRSHTTIIFIQQCMAFTLCVKSCVCLCISPSFLSGLRPCRMWCSHSGSLSTTPINKRRMPTSCCPQACQSCLKGEGPHNLLFVSLLLRKYFLNSSFSFVYFYCSYFLPWFNPVLSYLFAF